MPQRPSNFASARRLAAAAALSVLLSMALAAPAAAYTANKVWFEFRPSGIYRVYVSYTVPELKEFREAYTEFRVKKDAEAFYWDLVKGADFYLPAPGARRFLNQPLQPSPW